MNKKMKKSVALLLAMVMVLSLAFGVNMNVSAAGSSGPKADDVDTVTSSESGINLTLFDFEDRDVSSNINHSVQAKGLESYIKWTGSLDQTHAAGEFAEDKYGEGFIHGMVANKLVNGYPMILKDYHDQKNQAGSMGFLFGDGTSSHVTTYNTNGGLFWVTEDGYYEYYSDLHAADYDKTTNRFYVRNYRETTESTASRGLKPTDIGYYDFLPFNYSDGQKVGTNPTTENDYHFVTDDASPDAVNYWFGMKLDTAFEQPKEGKLDNGNEMVFRFTGDDDVWLFIDGVLVLDMGGTHAASSGEINFATGEITYRSYNPNNNFGLEKDGTAGTGYDEALKKYTIKECFKEAGVYAEDAFDGDTFADYTRHRIDYFYMERGSSSSCCHIKFNIPTIPTAKVGITKEVESEYDETAKDLDYQMKLYVETETGSGEYVPFKGAYTLGDETKFTAADGTFTIKGDETALFDVPLGRTYFVQEYEIDGYKVTYKYDDSTATDADVEGTTATSKIYEVKEGGSEVVVKNTVLFTEFNGKKEWKDNNNQDGIRPESITINLLADGVEVAEKVVTEADKWAWTFDNMPIYKDGVVIEYTITEDEVPGYTASVTGMNVTNTHTPEKIDISGSKTWDDADDQDGVRPEEITINLLADGEVIDTVTVTEADGWAWTFEGLDKYKDQGTEIVYTITEEVVDGYTTEVKDFDVTNTHTPETTMVEGGKTWDDADDQDGVRPEEITIRLLADGTEVDSAVVTENDAWSWAFTELPKYRDQGVEIVYTIVEDAIEGYEASVDGYDVTNTHVPEETSVDGTKTWDDADDQDGVRPEEITINLLADGEVIDTVTVTEADKWTWNFTGLPKYRDQGIEIVYTITEDAVENYTTNVEGYDVTNTHIPAVTSVEGTKTWDDADNQDGIRPEEITINLLADGEVIDTVTVTEEDGWAWSFTQLPQYRDHGVEIEYTITEEAVEGYETTIEGYDVTNTHTPEVVEVLVTKTWVDDDDKANKRPESITINLFADGEVIDSVEVTEETEWTWTFTDLPKYRDQGVEIVYTITEDEVDHYKTEIDGYDVTNTYIPPTVDTGDHANTTLYIALMGIAALAMVVALRKRVR